MPAPKCFVFSCRPRVPATRPLRGVAKSKTDRLMRGFVDDPRYKAFLRKLKLPE